MAFWSVKVTPNYIKIVEVIRLLNFQNIHFFRFTLPKNDSVTRKGMTIFWPHISQTLHSFACKTSFKAKS